jgi:O-antigen/teichoic acid export membrane protein
MRKTLENLTSVVGGEFVLRTATFVAAVLIARLYGAATLGTYTTALAFATLLATVGDNGLNFSSIAEVSRRPHETDSIISSLYVVKTLLLAIAAAIALFVAWAWHIKPTAFVVGALVMGKIFLNSYGQANFSMLKALDRMRPIGMLQFFHSCALLGGMAMVYRFRWGIGILLAVFLGGQIAEILASSAVLWRLRVRLTHTSFLDCFHLIKLSTPVGASSLLANFILRLDVLVVSLFYSPLLVGHFAAANNGVVAMYAVAGLFGSVLLPEMAKIGPNLAEFMRKWLRIVCAVCVPMVIVVVLCATRLVVLVYGRSFAEAGPLVAVMAIAVPLIVLNAMYYSRAVALQMRGTYLSIFFGTALLAVALDITFARYLGLMGVAAAIVIREATMLTAFLVSARGNFAVPAAGAASSLSLQVFDSSPRRP